MKQATTKSQTNCGNIYILAALTGELQNCPVGDNIQGCSGCQEYMEAELERLIHEEYILPDFISSIKNEQQECKHQNGIMCLNPDQVSCNFSNELKPKRQHRRVCCYKCGHYDECRHNGTMCDK